MTRDARGVLRGVAPGFGAGARYGFRVEGPYDPARGARFDASKLLADPYAWRFDRPFRLHPSMFAFGDDSGPFAPKAIAGAPPEGEPGRKRVAPEALIIYELNLRGFSRLNPAIPESARGTFAGLAHPASIAHLAAARRHRGRDHAGRRVRRRTASARRSASRTPGATIRWCSARPTRDSRPAAGRMSAPRPTRFMRRAWRRSSTSSSTTTARATNSGRRCRSAASTTRPGSVSIRAIRRPTSTTWAPAIASRSIARWSSPWRSARSGAGWSTAASTAFASISPPRSGGARLASIPMRRSSTRSPPTRSSRTRA